MRYGKLMGPWLDPAELVLCSYARIWILFLQGFINASIKEGQKQLGVKICVIVARVEECVANV